MARQRAAALSVYLGWNKDEIGIFDIINAVLAERVIGGQHVICEILGAGINGGGAGVDIMVERLGQIAPVALADAALVRAGALVKTGDQALDILGDGEIAKARIAVSSLEFLDHHLCQHLAEFIIAAVFAKALEKQINMNAEHLVTAGDGVRDLERLVEFRMARVGGGEAVKFVGASPFLCPISQPLEHCLFYFCGND